jgi:predicted RNA-binding Zn-ribbon protein involved in translation (DUF1610 family)
MEYLIVLNLIALSVALVFAFTDWNNKNTQGGIGNPKAKNPTTKRCPSCGEEIQSDILRCRQCGSFVDFFRNKP